MTIKPGQIPDWRPGAVFWKPLADGREVTIYPLLHGKARLCVGPLADPHGYDVAYRYESVDAATKAAEDWDPDQQEQPFGFEAIDFAPKQHRKQRAPVHSEGVQVGQKMELRDDAKEYFTIHEVRGRDEIREYTLEGLTEDGFQITIEAVRRTGDPTGNTGAPLVTVTNVTTLRGPSDG